MFYDLSLTVYALERSLLYALFVIAARPLGFTWFMFHWIVESPLLATAVEYYGSSNWIVESPQLATAVLWQQ